MRGVEYISILILQQGLIMKIADNVVTKAYLKEKQQWFIKYAKSLTPPDPDIKRNIELKTRHTFRVCAQMLQLCRSFELDEQHTLLGCLIALFHDVGRFEQYHKHKTF